MILSYVPEGAKAVTASVKIVRGDTRIIVLFRNTFSENWKHAVEPLNKIISSIIETFKKSATVFGTGSVIGHGYEYLGVIFVLELGIGNSTSRNNKQI